LWRAADFAQKLPGLVELEQPRAAVDVVARRPERRVRAAAPVVDPDVPRRGRGHTGDFAEMDVIRQLQEIAG
jgi:hypothetical protein